MVRWFDVTPDYNPFRATLGWTSEDRLVVIAHEGARLPYLFGDDEKSQADQVRAWQAMRAGDAPTATVIGSGEWLGATPLPTQKQLLLLDVSTGARRVLSEGALQSIAVAPGGCHVAVVSETQATRIVATGPILPGIDPRHRALTIVDVAKGSAWRPSRGCDIPVSLPSWSPDGGQLLFLGKAEEAPWSEGRVWRADVGTMALSSVSTGFRPHIRTSRSAYADVALGWDERVPLGFGYSGQAGRPDWYRLDGAPVRLTGRVAHPSFDLIRLRRGAPAIVSDDRTWALGAAGARQITSAPMRTIAAPQMTPGGERASLGTHLLTWRADSGSGLTVAPRRAAWIRIAGEGRDIELVTTSREYGVAVGVATDPHGVAELLVYRENVPALPVAKINAHLGDVDNEPPVALDYRLPDGRAVTSWLYLPERAPAAGKAPLVVIPYAGLTYGAVPPKRWAPGEGTLPINAAVLRGCGYAVLVPSMPELPAGDGPFDFAGQILAGVDAASATGKVDPDRLAMWGHSFGGYIVALTATQTDRFKAIIASNGIYDLASNQGSFTPQFRLDPGDNAVILQWAGYNESSQPHLGATPWENPARYAASSVIARAGRITTPLLILAGDRDFSHLEQSEQLFSALYRQGKDALLVSYWGENHVLASPANLRDSYARVLQWLDRHLTDRDGLPCIRLTPSCQAAFGRSSHGPSVP